MADKNVTGNPAEYMRSIEGVNKKITGSYDESRAVTCPNGTYVGDENEGILCFKGIPYAVQPVGSRRWKNSEPLPESDDVFEAKYFGKTSVQPVTHHERSSLYLMGEDCLNLNIWTDKASIGDKKPVMMFIHGGAYVFGGAQDPTYDGQNLIKTHRDVVLVTISYRVGILGFADFEDIEGGEDYKDCNFGLSDQINALKWIQKNISAFGGDPDNVTIFGESAGGGSVSSLCIVPAAKGLFRRVIAQSGAVGLSFSREYMRKNTKEYFERYGCKTMAEALAWNWEDTITDFQVAPVRDTKEIPYATLEESFEAFKTGFAKDVDVMTGTNEDESRYFVFTSGDVGLYKDAQDANLEKRLSFVPENLRRTLRDIVTDGNGNTTLEGLLTLEDDIVFHGPSFMQAEKHAESNGSGKTYVYGFTTESHVDPAEYGGFSLGACHGIELTYVFGSINDPLIGGPDQSREFSRRIQDIWVNFAKTGNPSIDGFDWPQFNKENWNVAILDDGKKGGIRLDHEFKKEEYLRFRPFCTFNLIEAGL